MPLSPEQWERVGTCKHCRATIYRLAGGCGRVAYKVIPDDCGDIHEWDIELKISETAKWKPKVLIEKGFE